MVVVVDGRSGGDGDGRPALSGTRRERRHRHEHRRRSPAPPDHASMMAGGRCRNASPQLWQVLLHREHGRRRDRRARRRVPSTSAASKRSSMSPSAHASTSSHVTGVDTVGSGRARSEYGAIVVLWWAFWLQSTKILPGRTAFAIIVVTCLGSCFSSTWPTARANSAACSCVTPGVLSGTYSCRPFDPDVLQHPSSPTAASTSRTCRAIAQQSVMSVFGPGSKSNTTARGESRSSAERHRRVQLDGGHVGGPDQRRRLIEAAVLDPALAVARAERDADPLRAVIRTSLLEEPLGVGAVGEPLERQRPPRRGGAARPAAMRA